MMIRERRWVHFDWLLLAAALLLVSFGLVLIYSATWSSQGLELIQRQAIFAFLGVIVLFFVARGDYRFLETIHRPIYILALFALLGVFVAGHISFGAQRWLDLALFPVQPAELAKVLIIISLAKMLSQGEGRLGLRGAIISALYLAGPILLIYLQPSLGAAISMLVVWLAMLLVAGIRLRYLLLIALVIVVLIPLAWNFVLADYMKERIITFLNPQEDPLGAGYNTNQALIAVGSGGLLGKGFLSGSQSQLRFLRVRHTDYIFSVLGEEWGLVGVVILLALIAILLWRILRAAEMAREGFGRLIAVGIAALIGFQAFVNVGMNLGLVPAAGIPLPLVSYGGSSLVALFLALGLVESILLHHRRLEF